MYTEPIEHFAGLGATKLKALRSNPTGFFVGAMMAGVYVGFGIILIFILGSSVDPSIRKLVMVQALVLP